MTHHFKKPNPKESFPKLEERILDFWKKEQIFRRSITSRSTDKEYTFYDGPPFATGLPHYGHILASVMKDMVPRYWTMRGYRVDRRWGWDCHGLPIEFEKEKELGLGSRLEIEEYGVDRFNESCRQTILKYADEWKVMIERLGRFVDMDDDYKTMEPWFMESIWWVFAELWKKDLVYLGKKVVPFSYRISSPLSNFEAQQNYQDRQDPAVTVKFLLPNFRFENSEPIYILAWTTTPWTLPSNLLLALGEKMEYVLIKDVEKNEQYVLAKSSLSKYYKDEAQYQILTTFHGSDLANLKYTPIFPYFAHKAEEGAFQTVLADFVTEGDGTGIVHLAPYGEDDFRVINEKGIEIMDPIQDDGTFTHEVKDFENMLVFDANKPIIERLKNDGSLVKQETIMHSYPHCWRTDTPLIYKPIETWFVRVTELKEKLIANNAKVHWVPDHMKDGRFGKWLENVRDWAISRNRFWGTPLPIWRTKDGLEMKVIAGLDELYHEAKGRLTKIVLLRHGESEKNVTNIWSSEIDKHHLTEKGKKQVSDTLMKYVEERPDVIYSSPILRARETAQAVEKFFGGTIEIKIDGGLIEMNGGDWEGKKLDTEEVLSKIDVYEKLSGSKEYFSGKRTTGSESYEDIAKRLTSLLKDIKENHAGKTVYIVSHAAVLQVVEYVLRNKSPEKMSTINELETGSAKTLFLDSLSGKEFDLHKHFVDGITLTSEKGELMYRVPEVFDCWFESGSMPYAQNHYPFENLEKTRKNFPADFIAEGADQTRGWFYTLMVLATALTDGASGLGQDNPAFKNVVVNGLVLAEDGKKMSKRLKNYPDPSEIFTELGADSLRFYLMNSPVVHGENLRFSKKGVEETLRKMILPLWHSYTFFMTYANVDNWDIESKDLTNISHNLDLWMLSEMENTERLYHEAMEKYDLKGVTDILLASMDAMTNWYIRRSRRRFWKSENDTDKNNAYSTLHEVLIRFCQLLAPITPFITEEMYMNLVPNAESVHLSYFDTNKNNWFDENLIKEVNAVRAIVQLGLAIRSKEKIKVRMPLRLAQIALPKSLKITQLEKYKEVILEELNVKEIRFEKDPEQLGKPVAKPDAKVLGPRLGGKVQEVIKEARAGNFILKDDGSIEIMGMILEPHEVEVGYESHEGVSAQSMAGIVVALDTTIDELLIREGAARDLVREIQDLRKDNDLAVTDNITILISGNIAQELTKMLEEWGDYIRKETLALDLSYSGDMPKLTKTLSLFDGECIVGIETVSKNA